jgi:hypothetical protein
MTVILVCHYSLHRRGTGETCFAKDVPLLWYCRSLYLPLSTSHCQFCPSCKRFPVTLRRLRLVLIRLCYSLDVYNYFETRKVPVLTLLRLGSTRPLSQQSQSHLYNRSSLPHPRQSRLTMCRLKRHPSRRRRDLQIRSRTHLSARP